MKLGRLVRVALGTLALGYLAVAGAVFLSQRWMLFFHGNGEQLADAMPLPLRLSEMGFGFYGVEYPGYDVSAIPWAPASRSRWHEGASGRG